MGALAVCDGCGWVTPVENTTRRPPGWAVEHAWAEPRGDTPVTALVPASATLFGVPRRRCGCPYCYRGPWRHVVAPSYDPGFLRFVVFGLNARDQDWRDYCPRCTIPEGCRVGLPLSWKLARWAFLVATILGGIAFWAHVFVGGAR